MRLVHALLMDPQDASIGFVLTGEPVRGLDSAAGRNLPELRILEKP